MVSICGRLGVASGLLHPATAEKREFRWLSRDKERTYCTNP